MNKKELIQKSLMLSGDYNKYHDIFKDDIKLVVEIKKIDKKSDEYKELVKEGLRYYKKHCRETEKIIDDELYIKDIEFMIWLYEKIFENKSYKKAVKAEERIQNNYARIFKEFFASQGIEVGG